MATKRTTTKDGFSAAEKAAMKERARELKAEARAGDRRAKGTEAVLEAVREMPKADRVLAERIHEIVGEVAPHLFPKTWYGMPAWATDEGKVVCFFKAAAKFDGRFAVLGFEDAANLDDGAMWPTVFAIIEMNDAVDKKVRALVKRATK